MGQAMVHGKGLVGAREHLAHGGPEDVRHVLAAEFLGQVERGPAARLDLFEGVAEAPGRAHHAIFQGAAFGVSDGVEGGQNFGGNLAGLFQNGGGEVGFEFAVAGRVRGRDPEHVMQQELHVFDGGGVAGHGLVSLKTFFWRRCYSATFLSGPMERSMLSTQSICSRSSAMA